MLILFAFTLRHCRHDITPRLMFITMFFSRYAPPLLRYYADMPPRITHYAITPRRHTPLMSPYHAA